MEHPSPIARDSGLLIDVLATGATPLVRLDGELDAASAHLLIDAIEPLFRDGASFLVLDCDALRFCDSSGLRALLTLRGMLPAEGDVSLVRTNKIMRRVLRITALDTLFEVS